MRPMPSKSGTTSSRSRRAEPARDSAGAPFTETGDMNLGLEGRAVLLAGASRGIGLATATAFAAEGSRIALMARDAANLSAAAREGREALHARPGRAGESAADGGTAVLSVADDAGGGRGAGGARDHRKVPPERRPGHPVQPHA